MSGAENAGWDRRSDPSVRAMIDAEKRALSAEKDAGCTVNLLGGTCPVGSLCPVHACTEELCRCEDEPCPIPPGGGRS